MKKYINKVILTALLATSPLLAADDSMYEFESHSLVAFEGGYSNFDVESTETPPLRESYKFGYGGIKIGAQTENYRLFLSGRYCSIDDFDYAYMMGVEAQYLFNFSSFANLYLGINAGMAEMRVVDAANKTRDVSDPYVGGDIGFNIHLGKTVDLELGARVMSLDAENTIDDVTYKFDSITSGYVSLIFKYQMD